jgi:hypothetical protein
MGLEMLTQQQLAAAAVEALAAELRVVGADTVAEAEGAFLDVAPERGHHANGLVAGDQGKTREEFAFVDVQVGAADAAGFDFDEDVVGAEGRKRDFHHGEFFGFGVARRKKGLVGWVNVYQIEPSGGGDGNCSWEYASLCLCCAGWGLLER